MIDVAAMNWQPILKPHRLLKKGGDLDQPMSQVPVYEAQAADGTRFTIEATRYQDQRTHTETLALYCAIQAPGKRVRHEALGKHRVAELSTERGRTSLESGIYTAQHWIRAVGKKPVMVFDHLGALGSAVGDLSHRHDQQPMPEIAPSRFPVFPDMAVLRSLRAEEATQTAIEQPRRRFGR